MQFIVKLSVTVAIIVMCAQVGRKYPALGGLLATMPLTSLIVLLWLHADQPGDHGLLAAYARGAFWGILPSLLFFAVSYLGFQRHYTLPLVLAAAFAAWLAGAGLHRWLIR
jgi:F0F1-type ATP synthase assembly protein I